MLPVRKPGRHIRMTSGWQEHEASELKPEGFRLDGIVIWSISIAERSFYGVGYVRHCYVQLEAI